MATFFLIIIIASSCCIDDILSVSIGYLTNIISWSHQTFTSNCLPCWDYDNMYICIKIAAQSREAPEEWPILQNNMQHPNSSVKSICIGLPRNKNLFVNCSWFMVVWVHVSKVLDIYKTYRILQCTPWANSIQRQEGPIAYIKLAPIRMAGLARTEGLMFAFPSSFPG